MSAKAAMTLLALSAEEWEAKCNGAEAYSDLAPAMLSASVVREDRLRRRIAELEAATLPAAPAPAEQQDELPITRSTYGSLEACEAEQARRNGAVVAPTPASYLKSQRKMIERAIIGLRDGWATRKDADDALSILGSCFAPLPAEQAGELPPLPPAFWQPCDGWTEDYYTAKQMRAYALDTLIAALKPRAAALAARQAPTEAPKLNQQQEETITLLRMWSEAGHRDLKLLNGDRLGVRALLARFDMARQAPDSRDAALEEAATLCDAQALEPECPERATYCADAIRALKGPAQ